VKSPDPRVPIKIVHNEGESLAVGLAQTIIDADLSTVVAYEFLKDSRERLAKLKEKRVIEQKIKKENHHCQLYFHSRDLGVRGLSNREYRLKCLWRTEEDKAWVIYESTGNIDQGIPVKPGHVVAAAATTWLFESLPCIGSTPQTRCTFITQNDLSGVIPTFFINAIAPQQAAKPVISLRKKFDRSREIDAYNRSQIAERMRMLEASSTVTFDESFEVKQGMAKVSGRDNTLLQIGKRAGSNGEGRTTVMVRADLEETAAFFWDFTSRANLSLSGESERVAEEERGGNWEIITRKFDLGKAVKYLADSFHHDEEIDRTALTSLANIIKNEPQVYTEEEEKAVKRGKVRLDKEETTSYYCFTTTTNNRLLFSNLKGVFRNVCREPRLQACQVPGPKSND